MNQGHSRIRSLQVIAIAVTLAAAGAAAGWSVARAQSHSHSHGPSHSHSHGTDTGGWLVGLGPEARVKAIERQFRGFETTMAEVSYRYTEMYFGGMDGNWGYAEHMAQTLADALAAGLERRPQHRKSAETLFLKGPYPRLVDAIKAKDPALFKERIEALRAACTACHAAEAHPFIKIGIPMVRRNPVVNDRTHAGRARSNERENSAGITSSGS